MARLIWCARCHTYRAGYKEDTGKPCPACHHVPSPRDRGPEINDPHPPAILPPRPLRRVRANRIDDSAVQSFVAGGGTHGGSPFTVPVATRFRRGEGQEPREILEALSEPRVPFAWAVEWPPARVIQPDTSVRLTAFDFIDMGPGAPVDDVADTADGPDDATREGQTGSDVSDECGECLGSGVVTDLNADEVACDHCAGAGVIGRAPETPATDWRDPSLHLTMPAVDINALIDGPVERRSVDVDVTMLGDSQRRVERVDVAPVGPTDDVLVSLARDCLRRAGSRSEQLALLHGELRHRVFAIPSHERVLHAFRQARLEARRARQGDPAHAPGHE